MSALRQPSWWINQQAPYSIAGKLDLVARRCMGGRSLFDALASVEGSGAALSHRLGLAHTGVDNWRYKGRRVPIGRVQAVAEALNIPASHIPHDISRLRKVGALIEGGASFHDALLKVRAGYKLSIALCVDRSGLWKWTRRGVPANRVAAVARVLGCRVCLLPVSRGSWRPPLSDEQKRRMSAHRRQPDVRAQMAAAARAQPRANGKFASKEART